MGQDRSGKHGAMAQGPGRQPPERTAAEGPWGGPVRSRRGAEIHCAEGGHICSLLMEGHPLHALAARLEAGGP